MALIKFAYIFFIRRLRKVIKLINILILTGNNVTCVICSSNFRKFLPTGILKREFWNSLEGTTIQNLPHVTICNAKCPKCGSSERQRLFYIYMKDKIGFDTLSNTKILEVGPDDFVTKVMFDSPEINYTSVDIARSNATQKMDLTKLTYKDNTFDNIFCYHVLEHISDDIKAMSELYRVLKPGGWGILQVPLWSDLTYEDNSLPINQYERVYGHPQHVRRYGKDYLYRLESVGFKVELDQYTKSLPAKYLKQYGILLNEDIYVCRK